MKNIKIELVDNIKTEDAKNIWNKLCPGYVICDDWNYRYLFYGYYQFPLFFYVGIDNGEIVGLLPLQFNEKNKYLEFFGGGFMRDNRVFTKPGYESCVQLFYKAIKLPARLKGIVGEDDFTKKMDIYKYKYIADISHVSSADEYLSKYFKSKTRYGLKKKIGLVKSMDPEIIKNNYDDIDLLIELNKKSFGEKSSLNEPYIVQAFHELVRSGYNVQMLSYIIKGETEAVSLSVKYGDAYIYINAGVNKNKVSNLGTFNIYKNIEGAIETGSKTFDGGLGDLNWKELWHLEKYPQHIFTNLNHQDGK